MSKYERIQKRIERRTYLQGKFKGKFIGYLDPKKSDLKNENFYDLEVISGKITSTKDEINIRHWETGEPEEFQKLNNFLTKLPENLPLEIIDKTGNTKTYQINLNEIKLNNYELTNQVYDKHLVFGDIVGNISGYLKHYETIYEYKKIITSEDLEDVLEEDSILLSDETSSNTQKKSENLQTHRDNKRLKNNSINKASYWATWEKESNDKDSNFLRYNFFLINYLLFNNKTKEAKKVIGNSRKEYNSNLLIKQTENFFLNNENKKIKNFFNCKNSNDSLSEFFYVIANLYSSEKDYKLSNFYMKISIFLNNKFLPNQTLLAENYYYQKKNELSKNIYQSLKSIGPVYSWHASKSIAKILSDERGKKYSVSSLENEFNLLSNPNFEHYYELANFYKDNGYFEKSIKYYSLALSEIKKDHFLVPKILDRRGTSFERIGDWENAEKDLIKSLEILPDQAHVLNYLAYSWIDQGINVDEGLEMLKKADKLRENDGYIIDSLGWAYYVKENYSEAELFLQKAVELLPLDPIINDHYADTLWMLNKNIQARYLWKYILKLDDTKQKLKDTISKKLIFGITQKL